MSAKRLSILTACVGVFLAVTPLIAHHSFSAQYDDKKPITLTGTVTKLEWMNPHTYFYLDVKDEQGAVQPWAFELAALNQLIRNGWNRHSLKPGEVVTVTGFLARSGARLVNASSIVRSDGLKVFTGRAPQ